jgi:hypothetical protein
LTGEAATAPAPDKRALSMIVASHRPGWTERPDRYWDWPPGRAARRKQRPGPAVRTRPAYGARCRLASPAARVAGARGEESDDEAGPAAGPAELAEAEAGDRQLARRRARPPAPAGSRMVTTNDRVQRRPARRRLLPARTGRGTITGPGAHAAGEPARRFHVPRAVPPCGGDGGCPRPLPRRLLGGTLRAARGGRDSASACCGRGTAGEPAALARAGVRFALTAPGRRAANELRVPEGPCGLAEGGRDRRDRTGRAGYKLSGRP